MMLAELRDWLSFFHVLGAMAWVEEVLGSFALVEVSNLGRGDRAGGVHPGRPARPAR
jgi:hypothetical protein